jgi:hypothetical protein
MVLLKQVIQKKKILRNLWKSILQKQLSKQYFDLSGYSLHRVILLIDVEVGLL